MMSPITATRISQTLGRNLTAKLGARRRSRDSAPSYPVKTGAIYRLITCESSRDIQQYLDGKGINWRSVENDSQSDEETEERESEEVSELLRSSLLASIGSTRTEARTQRDSSDGNEVERERHPNQDSGHDVEVLPPIDEVDAVLVEPTDGWSHAVSSSHGGGSGGSRGSPTKRDQERDEETGRRGEEIVVRLERERVRGLGFPANRVVWKSEANPVADFDILSVDDDGDDLFIEVKSTSGSDGRFQWSRVEFERALRERRRYVLYRVYRARDLTPVVRPFRDPIALLSQGGLHLDIETLRAEVEPSN